MTERDAAQHSRSVFCERCGRRYDLGPRSRITEVLRRCRGCDLYTCPSCRASAAFCLDCVAPSARPSSPAASSAAPSSAGLSSAASWSAAAGRRTRRLRAAGAEAGGVLSRLARTASDAARSIPRLASHGAGRVADAWPRLATRRRRARAARYALPAALMVAGAVVLVSSLLPAPPIDPAGQASGPLGAVAPASGRPSLVPASGDPSPRPSEPPAAASEPPPEGPSSPPSSLPGSPSPEPTAPPPGDGAPAVTVETAVVRATSTGVTSHATVVAILRNDGPGAVELPPSSTRFEVRKDDGTPAVEGVFTYVIPPRLGPGQRAYAVEVMPAVFTPAEDLGDVSVNPTAVPAEALLASLRVSDVAWSPGPDGEPRATGRVTNDALGEVTGGFVSVVLLDAENRPLAVLYDLVDVATLAPGESRDFETGYPRSVPLRPDQVARVEAVAYDLAGLTAP